MAIENIVKANADNLVLLLDRCPIIGYNKVKSDGRISDVLHFEGANGMQITTDIYYQSSTARDLFRHVAEKKTMGLSVSKEILADNLEKMAEYRLDMTGISADIVDVAVGRYMESEASMQAETSAVID